MSRQTESIKRQVEAGGSLINLVIPADAKARLDKIKAYRSMTKKAAIIKLLTNGMLLRDKVWLNLEKIATRQSLTPEEVLEWLIYSERVTDRAHELMDKHGSKSAALTEYFGELNQDYPGFVLSKRDVYPVAYRLYNQMNTALGWEEMGRNTVKSVSNTETTGESSSASGFLRSIFQGIKSRTGR